MCHPDTEAETADFEDKQQQATNLKTPECFSRLERDDGRKRGEKRGVRRGKWRKRNINESERRDKWEEKEVRVKV